MRFTIHRDANGILSLQCLGLTVPVNPLVLEEFLDRNGIDLGPSGTWRVDRAGAQKAIELALASLHQEASALETRKRKLIAWARLAAGYASQSDVA